MKNRTPSGKKKRLRLILALLAIAAVCACAVYLLTYYPASREAMQTLQHPAEGVTVTQLPGNRIVFLPDEPVAGLIFYPGGKVQYEAYAPLMNACAARGILCVVVHMPFNLAVFHQNAADGIAADYPQITDWYIGGHSLGGVMAASYAASHSESLRGLVLLASYTTKDLRQSSLRVLGILAENDGILKQDQYEAARSNLPAQFTELVIPGGCHAYFGSYGAQAGDGTPAITEQAQREQVAEAVAAWIAEGEASALLPAA